MLHLNASDEKNVEMFRRRIFQFATSQNLFLDRNKKMVFIDEVDMLSDEMQTVVCDGLSQLSEHLYFVLCGNNHYSLQLRLLSRVVCIMFPPLTVLETCQGLLRILHEEGMESEDSNSACHYLYIVLGGDLRKMVNSLQAILLRCGTFSVSSINKILLNNVELDANAFVCLLQSSSIRESVAFLTNEILENSQDFIEWVRYIFNFLFQNFFDQKNEKVFLQFTQLVADIEHNASFVVDYEIQIYSFVALTHRFVKNVVHPSAHVLCKKNDLKK